MTDTRVPMTEPEGDSSPFGAADLPVDRWLKIAVWAVAVAVLLAAGYLGWVYVTNANAAKVQSPAGRAAANLAAVVKKSPKNAGARVKLAEALAANGQIDDAIAQLKVALQLDKANYSARVDLGLIAMQRKEWPTAEGYWKQLITDLTKNQMSQQDQRLADVYYYLGTTYMEQQRYEDAVANLKKSIGIKRDSSPVHYMLSVAYGKLDITAMQEQELRIVIAFDPKAAQANYDLGMLALAKGDKAGAAEYFRVAADNAPDGVRQPAQELDKLGDADAHLSTATSLKSGDPEKALVEARIAAALDPNSTAAVKLVAQLAEKTGDKTRALNAWQRYLELVPNDQTANDAIKRLSPND